jgi:hypothetical protein
MKRILGGERGLRLEVRGERMKNRGQGSGVRIKQEEKGQRMK